LGGGPFRSRRIQFRFHRLAPLPFVLQLRGQPVALSPQGGNTLIPLGQGDRLFGGLVLVLPKPLLGYPEGAFGRVVRTLG
jgi:hypothetical protein